ncbi:unnamed protein product [Mesocestoides corti]|uniref:Amino acid transporter transmembrane domain-containing protein n=1 Tax=Mesocestoides corti TaxID=53468 RepID=A0A0R3U443_MESCO|nr:unnamed protein product [Mesocestoides corti]
MRRIVLSSSEVEQRWCCAHRNSSDDSPKCFILLIIFACSLGPFFFCNVTKTRWLQIGTTIARWVSIILMSSIAIARIIEFPEVPRLDHHQLPTYMSLLNTPVRPNPPIANFAKLPSAFGVCVYSFMCHHSLPGIITPISNKRRLFVTIMLPVYLIIFACYLLLSGTAVAAFDYIHDLYTLNFVPTSDPSLRPGWLLLLADYFLALYPVFALSSSFPVIGTTLTNNLRSLFLLLPSARRGRLVVRWGVPFLALVPPILFSMAVNDVGELVGITGAFGGSGIMYIFPGVLVFYARKALMIKVQSLTLNDESVAGDQPGVIVVNPYRSPFSHSLWLILVILWAISCLFIVILNKFSVL